MVDANRTPKDLLCSDQKQIFRSDSIQFYTVSGSMKTAPGGAMEDYRTLNFITYDIDGTRTQRRLKPNGTWSAEERADILAFINDVQDRDKPQVVPTRFIAAFSDVTERDENGNSIPNQNRYPLYVTVESELTQRGTLRCRRGVRGSDKRSFGPSRRAAKTMSARGAVAGGTQTENVQFQRATRNFQVKERGVDKRRGGLHTDGDEWSSACWRAMASPSRASGGRTGRFAKANARWRAGERVLAYDRRRSAVTPTRSMPPKPLATCWATRRTVYLNVP
jgi:hypothetical protein